ncbi:hypothetical protein SAMN05444157_1760 [Frankineae bacterium MT45]|nr:hypothetical protein SAMN05444157_1760 [Frankineae bacterium MT45]
MGRSVGRALTRGLIPALALFTVLSLSSCGGKTPSAAQAQGSATLLASDGSGNPSSTASGVAVESHSAPATEGTSQPTSTGSGGNRGTAAIHVGGPSLGGNDSGVWNNWGYVGRVNATGYVPVGHTGPTQGTAMYLHSSTLHSAKVVSVKVSPAGSPFHIVHDHCTGTTVGASASTDTTGIATCQIDINFKPTHPAPIHHDFPAQGYFTAALVFTTELPCTNRAAPVCNQIPHNVTVSATHPQTVTWQSAAQVWGSTGCPLPSATVQLDGCPTLTPTPSPTDVPPSPTP